MSSSSKDTDAYHCVVSVVGYVAHGRVYRASTEGTGKSCLCCRFTHPAVDDYIDDHPSLLALHEFENNVVSTDNFLYWGPVTLDYPSKNRKGAKVTMEVLEHTLFYHDETSSVFQKFTKQLNVDTYAKQALIAPDSSRKISYYSRDSIGFPDRYTCLPYPSNVNRIPRGFILAIDVSHKLPQFQQHFTAMQQIANQLFKDSKHPFIIAATKRDMADLTSLQKLQDWAAKKKVTVIETSAKENINIRSVFSHIAAKILKAAKLPETTMSYSDAAGLSLSIATETRKKFKDFLNMHVRSSSSLLSSIEERPVYLEAVEMFGKFRADEIYASYLLEIKNEEVKSYPGVFENPDMRMEMLEQFVDEIMDELIAHKRMLKSKINSLVSPNDLPPILPKIESPPLISTDEDHYEMVDGPLSTPNHFSDQNLGIEDEYDTFSKETTKTISAPNTPAPKRVTNYELHQVNLKKQLETRNGKEHLVKPVEHKISQNEGVQLSFQDRTKLVNQQMSGSAPTTPLLLTKLIKNDIDLSADNSDSSKSYGFLHLPKTQNVDNNGYATSNSLTNSNATKRPRKPAPPPPPPSQKPTKPMKLSNQVPSDASIIIRTDLANQSPLILVPKNNNSKLPNNPAVETKPSPDVKPKPKKGGSNYPLVSLDNQTQPLTVSPLVPKKGLNYQLVSKPTANNNNTAAVMNVLDTDTHQTQPLTVSPLVPKKGFNYQLVPKPTANSNNTAAVMNVLDTDTHQTQPLTVSPLVPKKSFNYHLVPKPTANSNNTAAVMNVLDTDTHQTQPLTVSPLVPKKSFNYHLVPKPTANSNNTAAVMNVLDTDTPSSDDDIYVSSSADTETYPKSQPTPLSPPDNRGLPFSRELPLKMSSLDEARINVKVRSMTTIESSNRSLQCNPTQNPMLDRKAASTDLYEHKPKLAAMRKRVEENKQENTPSPSHPAPPLPIRNSPSLIRATNTTALETGKLLLRTPIIPEMSHSKSMEINEIANRHDNGYDNQTLSPSLKNIHHQLPLPLPPRTKDMIDLSFDNTKDRLQNHGTDSNTQLVNERPRSDTNIVPSSTHLAPQTSKPSKNRRNYTDVVKNFFGAKDKTKDESNKPNDPNVRPPQFVRMVDRPLPAEPVPVFDDDLDHGDADYEPIDEQLRSRSQYPMPPTSGPISPLHSGAMTPQLSIISQALQIPKEKEAAFMEQLLILQQNHQLSHYPGNSLPPQTRNPAKIPKRSQSVNYQTHVNQHVNVDYHEYEPTEHWLPSSPQKRILFPPSRDQFVDADNFSYDYPDIRGFGGRKGTRMCPPRSTSSSPRKLKPRALTPPLDEDGEDYTHMYSNTSNEYDYENFDVINQIKTGKRLGRNNSLDDIHLYCNTFQEEIQKDILPARTTSYKQSPWPMESVGKPQGELEQTSQVVKTNHLKKSRPLPPRNKPRSERSPPLGDGYLQLKD